MNVASALIKQILALQDFETWNDLRQHYLPSEYHPLYRVIERHTDSFHSLPTFEDLELGTRDGKTREAVFAVKSIEIDIDPPTLLEYLKNEFTQKELLSGLDTFLDDSICFETAEESIAHLHQIIMDVEEKVDLDSSAESMQRIALFDSDEDLAKHLALGLNSEHDHEITFSPRDFILIGGRRGGGKSITCANIANNVYEAGKSAIYFTIEMDSRSTIQRACAIGTGISFSRIKNKNLSCTEWTKVAKWWCDRFLEGDAMYEQYKAHNDFERLHTDLSTKCQIDPVRQLDVIYDPSLTVSKVRAELDRRAKSEMDIGVIVVDYLNQLRRSNMPARGGIYDWTEQIEVSKALKVMAQEYEVPIVSPYQIDASGEARFAKGILDAADAAYTLDGHAQEDQCITFTCVKQRNAALISFTSAMDWETLKVGPESALTPKEKEDAEHKTGEEIHDM